MRRVFASATLKAPLTVAKRSYAGALVSSLNRAGMDAAKLSAVDRTKPLIPAKKAGDTRHTLVLDIDQTLLDTDESMQFTTLRPHVIPFLREVNELFEVVIWTAGTQGYGIKMLEAIENGGKHIDSKPVLGKSVLALYRQHTLEQFAYMKYIPHLGRPVTKTLMVDDATRSYFLTPRQAVLCEQWVAADDRHSGADVHAKGVIADDKYVTAGRARDTELLDMLPMLRAVAAAPCSTLELDHWRPTGYESTDDILTPHRTSGVGKWVPERRLEGPIPPLGPAFHRAWGDISPEIRAILGTEPLTATTA
jgi:hypothetical protein